MLDFSLKRLLLPCKTPLKMLYLQHIETKVITLIISSTHNTSKPRYLLYAKEISFYISCNHNTIACRTSNDPPRSCKYRIRINTVGLGAVTQRTVCPNQYKHNYKKLYQDTICARIFCGAIESLF